MSIRIKYIIPFPLESDGIALRADQIGLAGLRDDTSVECVGARGSGALVESYFDSQLFDIYITEAGIRAQEEGFDAVVMDTVSDAGLYALRARLDIPVIGPGMVSYALAFTLGKRFSIITMWSKWRHIYERTMRTYGIESHCASVRAIEEPPDVEELFGDKREAVLAKLIEAGRSALDEDGADVLLLGSTTMHEAGERLAQELEAPVINPGPAALRMAESIVGLRLSHSKRAFPSPVIDVDDRYLRLPNL